MTTPKPPIDGPDWKVWARQIRTYLQTNLPLLGTKSATDSPAQDGVLLWDGVNKYPIVAIDGVWRSIALDDDGLVFVSSVDDLPAASSGVITLGDNVTYWIIGTVDLAGDRIVGGQNTTILGASSENSRLKSTGLTDPLITSEWSMPIRHITLESDTIFDLDAIGNANQAIDWYGVNLVSSDIGTIANYTNFISASMAGIGSSGLILDGTFDTIGISGSIFTAASGTIITIPSTAIINRRFRVSYSALVSTGTATAIDVSVSASIPVEGYILDTVNFSGGATYLSGLDYTSDSALFSASRGVTNTAVSTGYYMTSNATATTIASIGVAVKASGASTASSISQKFDNSTSNKAIYNGALPRNFFVSVTLTMTSNNNNQLAVYLAKNGSIITSSKTLVTANSSGRVEDASLQDLVSLTDTDYIEIFVANQSASNNITVVEMNLSALAITA